MMRPIKANRLSSIVLILLDILADSEKSKLFIWFSWGPIQQSCFA
jgi:hypothetical protein